MSPDDLVSVVIPVYNMAATLPRAVASVLSQTYSHLELIVVDDGSLKPAALSLSDIDDQRVQIIEVAHNKGAANARNLGAQRARGRYLAFLDADDYWLPEKLEEQIAYLRSAPGQTKACCTGYFYHQNRAAERQVRLPDLGPGWLRQFLDVCSVCPGSTLCVETDLFLSLGGLDVRLKRLEDWDWLLTYCLGHPLGVVSRPLAVVENNGWPSPETVAAAGKLLLARKADPLRASLGPSAVRRFASSLEIETAIASLMAGRYGAFAVSLLKAGRISPARTAGFLLHALRKRVAMLSHGSSGV